ncbi:MAG: hypothetical protein GX104_11200 [Spirochaetales bacterium]|nr:hypothetical protein [Spirochaetales bacterium]
MAYIDPYQKTGTEIGATGYNRRVNFNQTQRLGLAYDETIALSVSNVLPSEDNNHKTFL